MSTLPTESAIKAALLTEFRARRLVSKRTILANEWAVGRTAVRADLALLGSSFIGVEIKSAADTLRRLPRQLEVYRAYFDQVILVLAERHLGRLREDLLDQVQVWSVDADGKLTLISEGVPVDNVERLCPTSLLTKKEVERYLRGVSNSELSEMSVRQAFAKAFSAKFGPTSIAFWHQVGRRRVTPDDLRLLSRYRDYRTAAKELERVRLQRWAQWDSGEAHSDAA